MSDKFVPVTGCGRRNGEAGGFANIAVRDSNTLCP